MPKKEALTHPPLPSLSSLTLPKTPPKTLYKTPAPAELAPPGVPLDEQLRPVPVTIPSLPP